MNEALDTLQRRDYNAPFGESYLRCDAACVLDLWLRTIEKPHLHHFQARFHRFTKPNELLVHSVVRRKPLRPIGGKQRSSKHHLGASEEHRPAVTVFVVIGEVTQQG